LRSSVSITARRPKGPCLLVEWESPGRAFLEAIGPALSRSRPPLAPERRYCGVPGRAIVASNLMHLALILFGVVVLPLMNFSWLTRQLPPPPVKEYKLTYVRSLTLPAMEDVSGAEQGHRGVAGGKTAFHPQQLIRIARGNLQVPTVYQPPKIVLPRHDSELMNLLVIPGATAVPASPDPMPKAASRRRLPALQPVVVPPPPPDVARDLKPKLLLPMPEVVAPPPDVLSGNRVSRSRWTELASNRNLPLPPPSASPTRPGTGSGAAGEEEVKDAGILISSLPGQTLGAPAGPIEGSLAMSPAGQGATGAGGSGGGEGIGTGSGPGAGTSGTGPGSGSNGRGYGASSTAKGGISPGPGPGGSGDGNGPPSPVPGVTISGGGVYQAGVVYLPSFGSSAAPNMAATPDRPLGPRRSPGLTVIATPRSGGALNLYGVLKGPKVYTIYFDTRLGATVLQFSELNSDGPGFDGDLTAPDPLKTDLPDDIRSARLILSCVIDRMGMLRQFHVLESGNAEFAKRVLDALANWRFRPVLRGNTAIAVAAILGFRVDTR
jgi:hypothetical protein